jgi:hypothetical protein
MVAKRYPNTAAQRRAYNESPRGRFSQQRQNARRRGVEWRLTFNEWWKIWQDSGHWPDRGKGKEGKYCMGRNGDKGAYEVGNVEIIKYSRNAFDSMTAAGWVEARKDNGEEEYV